MQHKKYNILFISANLNYFTDNHASFSRMYNNLIYFHKHDNFDVYVLQPKDYKERENQILKKDIKTYYFRNLKIAGIKLTPFTDLNIFFIMKIIRILKRHEIDLIHVDYVYGINCLRLFRNISVSYNAYNVEYIFANQIGKYDSKIPKIFRILYPRFIYFLENYTLKFVKNVNAVSYLDRKKFIEIYNTPKEKINLSPFGIRKDIFENPMKQEKARARLHIDKDKFIVIFHGSYFLNYANVEAINIIKDKIAPLINDKDIMILIAGKMPPFKNKDNLIFLGFVKDLKDFIYSADIAIAPILRGSGVKTKIIDYLSGNIPVITTKKGAEGLYFKDGIHGYIVNDINEIIEKIIKLKKDPKMLNQFKKNINILISKNYKWQDINKKLEKRYRLIIRDIN